MSAMKSNKITILHTCDVEKCRKLTNEWKTSEESIAVDAEGLSLSSKGRLTLLQLATRDGHVVICDVINPDDFVDCEAGKRLLDQGGVKDLLESTQILKITHSCHADSGALSHQFGITLRHVFDTQAANLAIQYGGGTRFPFKRNLETLCEIHVGKQLASKTFKEEWLKDQLMFWGRRPLTPQAIDYAAGDVLILHELHDVMKMKMSEHEDSGEFYRQCLDLEINEQREEARVKADYSALQWSMMHNVFRDVKLKARSRNPQESSTVSDDERRALQAFRDVSSNLGQGEELPPHMRELENALIHNIERDSEEFKEGGRSDFEEFDWKSAYALTNHPERSVSDRMKAIIRELRICRAESDLKQLITRLRSGKVHDLDDMTSSDVKALEGYRAFHQDLKVDFKVPEEIKSFELEHSRKVLRELENMADQEELYRTDTRRVLSILWNLVRHQNRDIRDRAEQLNSNVMVHKTKEELLELQARLKTEQLSWDKLTDTEKRTIRNYRQYKTSMPSAYNDKQILALEEKMSHLDLNEYELWQRRGELQRRIRKADKDALHAMAESDVELVRARAQRLREDIIQQRKSARGRGRGRRY